MEVSEFIADGTKVQVTPKAFRQHGKWGGVVKGSAINFWVLSA